jgi:hypothetical protein
MRILPTIIALLLPLTILSQVKETILNEHFLDNSVGWPEDITNEFSASVNGGTYYLSHKRATGSKIFDVPVRMFLGDNYYIETEGELRAGSVESGYGIVWGKGKGGYFTFAITGSGKFFVRKMKAGHSGSFLLGPTPCKHIYKATEVDKNGKKKIVKPVNKLRVQYANDEIMFFINDKYVGHIPNELYFGNNAGVILYGRQDVWIKNFGAFGTKSYERIKGYNAAMRVITYEIEDGIEEDGERLGNGNYKAEPGETIRLAVTMKNQGFANCDGLKATFYAVSGYVTVLDQDVPQYIHNVDRGHTQVFDLKFKVSAACRVGQLKFNVDLTDSLGRLAESVPMTVVLNTPIPPINKDGEGKISFTFNLKEADYSDINTAFPLTLNNADETYAVIVGVESYMRLPKAKYATNDTRIFYNYLVKVMNVPRGNIIHALNHKATMKDVVDIFKIGGELQSRAYTKHGIDLIFYFTGLGACDNGGTEPCLMLYDSNAASPKETGYPLSSLLKALRGYDVHSLTCLFETSFAGVDRDGVSFVQNDGVVKPSAAFPIVTDSRTCLMYASGGDFTNPVVDQTSHGMFTHYLLSTLQTYAKSRTTLDIKHLYQNIYERMERDGTAHGIKVFPRMDCVNVDGIKLLK